MSDLKHLSTAWDVDRTIVLEDDKVVAVRFSRNETCLDNSDELAYENYLLTAQMDASLSQIATKVRNFCAIYAVDVNKVTDFDEMYELGDLREPFGLIFFFRNKRIQVDLSTGNNNKINFVVDPADLIDIIELVYRGGQKGHGLVRGIKKFNHVAVAR